MSVAAARTRRARLRVSVSAETAAACGAAILLVALIGLTWGAWGDLDTDTGYDLLAGWHVSHGQLPYVDFIYYYGPLAPFLLGFAGLLGGGGLGLGAAIVVGMIIAVAIVAATFALARTVVGPLGAFLATAITTAVAFIPGNYSYVLPHTDDATLGTLVLLLALLCIRRYAGTGGTRWLVALGAGVGLAALTKPESAVAGWFAAVLWLALRARHGADLRREAVRFLIPAIAIPALVYGAFLGSISLHRLVYENLYPTDILRGSPIVKSRMPMTISSFVDQGGRLILYAVGAGAILAAGWLIARRRDPARLLWPLTGAAAVVLAAALAVRPEAVRHLLELAWGWVPAGALLATALLAWHAARDRSSWSPTRQVELAGAAVLAVLAATTYPNFFPHAPNEQTGVYYIPFAAILIVRLHLVVLARTRPAYVLGALWIAFLAVAGVTLTLRDTRAESATVRGPGGALTETPDEARLYETAIRWIDRSTKPGEPIFVAPFMTSLYALSGHPTPLPQLVAVPGAFPTRADEQVAIERLDRAGVRVVVTDDRPKPEYGQTTFGGSYDRTLSAWIKQKFRLAARVHIPPHVVIPAGNRPARTLFVWVRRS